MQPSYINLLSLSPCTKEVPYLGTGIAREDGQINHGFKNLIAYPDLIGAIPELATDRSIKSLVYLLNTETSRFFTTGCFRILSKPQGVAYILKPDGKGRFKASCGLGLAGRVPRTTGFRA